MRRGVFVNYRVGDRHNEAAFIADGLARQFGPSAVFFASRSLQPGGPFAPGLLEGVHQASVLLAVIGPQWLTVTSADGRRRIDDPDDWVRREIAEALAQGIPVIPVLIGDRTLLTMPPAESLPDDIAGLSARQYIRLHYQDLQLDRVVEKLIEVCPDLATDELFVPPQQLPSRYSPSTLLRAEHSVVPFHGREKELLEVTEWCAGPATVAARLITGPGGQGKTRMAQQACALMREQRWPAGFLAEQADPAALRRLRSGAGPLLLVVDYAEARLEQLITVAQAVRGRPSVRMLLLARAPGDWQRRLTEHSDDQVSELFRAMTHHRLAPLAQTAAQRDAEYRRAIIAFGLQLGRPTDELITVPLRETVPEHVLDVHAEALSAVLDAAESASPSDRSADPLTRVLDHERRYWRRTLPGFGVSLDDDEDLVDAVVGVGTLFAPATEDEAAGMIRATGVFAAADRRSVRRLARWAASLYPGGGWLNPLRPDRLGEDHVAMLARTQAAAIQDPFGLASDEQMIHALTVLGRAASRHLDLASTITEIFRRDSERRLGCGLRVAPIVDDPRVLTAAMVDVLGAVGDQQVVDRILGDIPGRSLALTDLAVLTTSLTLDNADQHAVINPVRAAHLLLLHSVRLAAAGRLRESLDATKRAVELFRPLAAANPGDRPNLARALRALARRLSANGQHSQALLAVDEAAYITRELAQHDPESYLPDLGDTLYVSSEMLSWSGQPSRALDAARESLEIFRRLADRHTGVYSNDVAMSLLLTGNRYSELGRHQDHLLAARQAHEILQALSDRSPDMHLPDYASALLSLARALRDTGLRVEALEQAEESASILRTMTGRYPQSYSSDLVSALSTQSALLTSVGEHQQAAAVLTEAVTISRKLAANSPESQLAPLATILTSRSHAHGRIGRPADGLADSDEATTIARDLVAAQPSAHRRLLADALLSRGNRLGELSEEDAALSATEEVVEIYRALAAQESDAYAADLGRALNNLAVRLGAVGRDPEALQVLAEVVTIRRALVDRSRDANLGELASALNNLAIQLDKNGSAAESLRAIKEAVELLSELAARFPSAYELDLATTSSLLGTRLTELGHAEAGVVATGVGVNILRRLSAQEPDLHRADLALALNNLAHALNGVDRFDEAAVIGGEAVALRRQLCAEDRQGNLIGLTTSLHNLAIALGGAGRAVEAVEASREALAIRRELAASRPQRHLSALALSLVNHVLQWKSGRGRLDEPEAAAAAEEAVGVLQPLFEQQPAGYRLLYAYALALHGQALACAGNLERAAWAIAEMHGLDLDGDGAQAMAWADEALDLMNDLDPQRAAAAWLAETGQEWPRR
ncbi:toll/interleukin-1 receptor domain-containing protein [Catellatospora tritici]|uniref:toll/interleukin-1 receptor domain-containing protein n=1 Tax=Catellatospora tritici TaxID=2851566 RepID=UPI001C2D5AA2|nr:toll/interleukin-1 receptor domain-containing protein [Catellatospora tritici]MBV1855167.1 toll/interleukin-1 receptor domain-containing protein [Catellatospora tritici]